jgi:hypothetical protein
VYAFDFLIAGRRNALFRKRSANTSRLLVFNEDEMSLRKQLFDAQFWQAVPLVNTSVEWPANGWMNSVSDYQYFSSSRSSMNVGEALTNEKARRMEPLITTSILPVEGRQAIYFDQLFVTESTGKNIQQWLIVIRWPGSISCTTRLIQTAVRLFRSVFGCSKTIRFVVIVTFCK